MEEPETFHDTGPSAEEESSPLLLERLHRTLARWNERRLRAEEPTRRWRDEIEDDLRMRSLEGEWIEAERAALAPWTRGLPRTAPAFLRWFEALRMDGEEDGEPMPGGRPSLDEVRWCMRQELAAGAGLDALVALLRIRLPNLPRVSRPIVGRDRLLRLARRVDVESDGLRAVWESLAVANLDVGFALSRRYGWHALGALGTVVMTAANRTERLARALRRLGIDVEEADLPTEHAQAAGWLSAVLVPGVVEEPDRITWLAEGALLRLRARVRCDHRYLSELGLSGDASRASGPTTPRLSS